MTKEDKLKLQARNAINFLEAHPACGDYFTRCIWWSIARVCKRGYDLGRYDGNITIYADSKYASKFKKEFKKEAERDIEEAKIIGREYKSSLTNISVPYEKVFGESWKPDHAEYWGEMSFIVFKGDPKIEKDGYDYFKWNACGGSINVSSPTFEGMIIKIAKKFKKLYGNWNEDKLLTPKERKNHGMVEPWFFKDDKEHKGFSKLEHNPKWIPVSPGVINRRWLEWFITTDHCKKNWSRTVKEFLS